jgi:hypothetical protein
MSTAAQIAANQKNSQLSTGPTSEAGNAKSSLNAVRSGLTGRTVLLPGDDAALYESHVSHFIESYAPADDDERNLGPVSRRYRMASPPHSVTRNGHLRYRPPRVRRLIPK